MITRSLLSLDKPAVVYDGDSPFCRWYVDHLSAVVDMDKIDARKDQAMVEQLDRAKINIDRDMVLLDDGQMFQGADALCRVTTDHRHKGGWFHALHAGLFRWRPLAFVIYAILRFLRFIYLRISGRSSIHSSL